MRDGGLNRVIGSVGLLPSALVGVLVLGSATNMSMASLLGVLVAQLGWNLAAAVFLLRTPARSPA